MSEELEETLEELFRYFQLGEEEWPMIPVYSRGQFYHGIIEDELYEVLTRLVELVNEERGE